MDKERKPRRTLRTGKAEMINTKTKPVTKIEKLIKLRKQKGKPETFSTYKDQIPPNKKKPF